MESMASKVEVYVEQNPRDQVVKEKRKRNGVKKSRDGCLTCRCVESFLSICCLPYVLAPYVSPLRLIS